MKLNSEQQSLVTEYLRVVEDVVRYQIRVNENVQGLGYDDLYQEGCMALCRASLTFNGSVQFKTYAQAVVKNRLIDHCRQALRRHGHTASLEASDDLSTEDNQPQADALAALAKAKLRYTGVARQGMEAMELKIKGYTGPEIAALYHAKPNEVGAWISRARQKLLRDEEFLAAIC